MLLLWVVEMYFSHNNSYKPLESSLYSLLGNKVPVSYKLCICHKCVYSNCTEFPEAGISI